MWEARSLGHPSWLWSERRPAVEISRGRMTLQTGSCGGVTEGRIAGYGPITAWQGYRANHSAAGLQGQSQRGRATGPITAWQGYRANRSVAGLQGQSQRGRVTGPIAAWQGYRANRSVAGLQGQSQRGRGQEGCSDHGPPGT